MRSSALLLSLALNACLVTYLTFQLSSRGSQAQSLQMVMPRANVRSYAPVRFAVNAVPKRTIAPSKKTVAPPARKTVAPAKKTVAPAKKTVAPPKKTVAPPKKTVAPAKKTVAPAKRTVAPKKTVAPKPKAAPKKVAVKKAGGGAPVRAAFKITKTAPPPRRGGKN
ncbi:hypothetical protein AAMO2058_001721100 [Amorphochlora amoebiformis]